MSELNPNHPVTVAMRDQWHKIAALVLVKFGEPEVLITEEDLAAITGLGIVVQETPAGLLVRLVEQAEMLRLARKVGGLPT